MPYIFRWTVTLAKGELFCVRIEYGGRSRSEPGAFLPASPSARDPYYGFDVTYTLSEPLNARDWFPVKQVLEDKIDSVRFQPGSVIMT